VKRALPALSLMSLSLFAALPAHAQDAPRVVVTIAPIHSLVAQVMDGVGEPELLVPTHQSPHGFAMRPSDATALSEADLVVSIGPNFELFLAEAMASLAPDTPHQQVIQLPGLVLRSAGEGHHHDHGHGHAEDEHDHDHEDHEAHADHDHHEHADHDHEDHGDHEHHDHADHDHEEEDHDHGADDEHEHDHEEHAHGDGCHSHGDGEIHCVPEGLEPIQGHDAAGLDAHIWLDPGNAMVMLQGISTQLSELDPAHADQYRANMQTAVVEVLSLDRELRERPAAIQDRPFMVFHDAYQYFDTRYGLANAGAVTLSPTVQPGAARIVEVMDEIAADGVRCVFAEPQFSPRILETIAESTDVAVGTRDPLGFDLTPGPDLYAALLRANADALTDCLSQD